MIIEKLLPQELEDAVHQYHQQFQPLQTTNQLQQVF